MILGLNGEIIDILKSRKKSKLLDYFKYIPIEERRRVKYVTMDMNDVYKTESEKVINFAIECLKQSDEIVKRKEIGLPFQNLKFTLYGCVVDFLKNNTPETVEKLYGVLMFFANLGIYPYEKVRILYELGDILEAKQMYDEKSENVGVEIKYTGHHYNPFVLKNMSINWSS